MLASCLPILLGLCLTQATDQERIKKLIETLSDASQEARAKAVGDLAAIGRSALDALEKAKSSADLEVKGLATQAIERIEWAGLEKLKTYVKEHLEEGATIEPSKMKALFKWFPDFHFYEVTGGAQPKGPAAMMGMPAPKCLFAVQKFTEGFHRLIVNGIYSTASVNTLLQKGKIVLLDEDAALDFAVAFAEVYSAGGSQNAAALMMGGGTSRLEKTSDGWSLVAGGFGANVVFRTEKDGKLVEIHPSSNPYSPFGLGSGGGEPGSEERKRLEVEKLKLEIDLLKRQLDKK